MVKMKSRKKSLSRKLVAESWGRKAHKWLIREIQDKLVFKKEQQNEPPN